MAEITVDIKGEEALAKAFGQAVTRSQDLRPFFNELYQRAYLPAMRETFDSEGPGWKPLHPAYLGWKIQNNYRQEIGRRTDRMMRSLLGQGSGGIRKIAKRMATFGTSVEYAAYFDAERPLLDNVVPAIEDYVSGNLGDWIVEPLQYQGVRAA